MAGAETFTFSPDTEVPEIGVGFGVDAGSFDEAVGFAPWVVELLRDIAGPAEIVGLMICDDARWRRGADSGSATRGVLGRLWPPSRWFGRA